jgi:hypothetical protein
MEAIVSGMAVLAAVIGPAVMGVWSLERLTEAAQGAAAAAGAEDELRGCGAEASHERNVLDAGELLAALDPERAEELRNAAEELVEEGERAGGACRPDDGERPGAERSDDGPLSAEYRSLAEPRLSVVIHREENATLPRNWPNWTYRLRYTDSSDEP